MKIIYIYDIKAKNKKKFNRTKRLFYYYLHKIDLGPGFWKTKSTIAVNPGKEKVMDGLFKKFGKSIEVYKIIAETIEEI